LTAGAPRSTSSTSDYQHAVKKRADDPEHTDELRIDLDPSAGVTFAMVQVAAREVRRPVEW